MLLYLGFILELVFFHEHTLVNPLLLLDRRMKTPFFDVFKLKGEASLWPILFSIPGQTFRRVKKMSKKIKLLHFEEMLLLELLNLIFSSFSFSNQETATVSSEILTLF